jgi:hypothetical protein
MIQVPGNCTCLVFFTTCKHEPERKKTNTSSFYPILAKEEKGKCSLDLVQIS